MHEPTLKDSTDYNGLKGEKKHVVYAVVAMLLAIGVLYSIAKGINAHVADEIPPAKIINYTK